MSLAAESRVVVVAGSSGFIGSRLCAHLASRGYELRRLVRREARAAGEFSCAAGVPSAALEGAFAVINLAGESVVGRWTAAKKQAILSSRVQTTSELARAIAAQARRPHVFVSASAIGYYGCADVAPVDEASPPGNDFLAQTCVAWEAAASAARAVTRVVHPRLGVVLHPSGGALAQQLPFFRAGVGGRVGSGKQFLSWIGLDDAVTALEWLITQSSLNGPVNLTAPHCVDNAEFTRRLAGVLKRPAWLPVPAFALQALYGEFAQEVVAGKRVVPRRLLASGFEFSQPNLEGLLRSQLCGARVSA